LVSREGESGRDIPSFQILYPCDSPLRIRDHLAEQVGEAGAAELGGSGPVEVAVVDCFAVGGGAETGVGLRELGGAGGGCGGGGLGEGVER